MKAKWFQKIILTLCLAFLLSFSAFAAQEENRFPFTFETSCENVDKLCYAGHITGGGMFYDDGFMVPAGTTFRIVDRLGLGFEKYEDLSMEIDLIYENPENTGVVKEVIRKFDYGDITADKEYPLFTETMQKNLKQRKKLYSSDIMTVKVVMNYQQSGGQTKKQVLLLYVAKNDEYNEKVVSLTAPPQ